MKYENIYRLWNKYACISILWMCLNIDSLVVNVTCLWLQQCGGKPRAVSTENWGHLLAEAAQRVGSRRSSVAFPTELSHCSSPLDRELYAFASLPTCTSVPISCNCVSLFIYFLFETMDSPWSGFSTSLPELSDVFPGCSSHEELYNFSIREVGFFSATYVSQKFTLVFIPCESELNKFTESNQY